MNSAVAAAQTPGMTIPNFPGRACDAHAALTSANVIASAAITFDPADPGVKTTVCQADSATCSMTP
jgi:hypothetical protein